jgi:hypothetical protein
MSSPMLLFDCVEYAVEQYGAAQVLRTEACSVGADVASNLKLPRGNTPRICGAAFSRFHPQGSGVVD